MLTFGLLLSQLLLVSLLLRALWLDSPDGQQIFDESYYVNAARVMLHLPVADGQPYAGSPAGLDPNTEHPPLGKAIIAGSMALLGDNPYGWRVPAVIFGTASIGLLAGAVLALGGAPATALTAAFMLAFDNLAFVHSRIGTLDVFLLGFSVLAVYCCARRWPLAAGASLALAGLVKINGLWLGLALLGFEIYLVRREGKDVRRALRSAAETGLAALAVFGAGLFALDRLFTTYATPLQHLQRIFSYGISLKAGQHAGESSPPWEWLLNQAQMPYYHLDRVLQVNGQTVSRASEVSFTGALNPYLAFLAPLAIGFAWWSAWRSADRVAALCCCWAVATYLPFFPLAATGRVSYLFYFLPTVPAVAMAIAHLMDRFPAAVRGCFLAAYMFGFASLFPFRVLP